MTATVTDLFCGAGGSSLGAEFAGMELRMAANHWQTAIDVHQAHFPDAGHDCADISQADPRRYPVTDILLASPECTNHSQARGVSRRQQDPTLWDAPDPAAERSRATMWDVPRMAEQNKYKVIVVENVVEATKWIMFPAWRQAMELLGYRLTIVSANSMHHGVPQSRDRVYFVWALAGIDVDLEQEIPAACTRCERVTVARQAWKNGRTVGRYRQQWTWNCVTCNTVVEPATRGAVEIIDWALACPRIGDRTRPLADKTRARILAGMQRYGWAPIVTAGAGNTHERTPGNRARPLTDPLPVQQTTATHALVVRNNGTPGGHPARHVTPAEEPLRTVTAQCGQAVLMNTAHGGRIHDLDDPHPTVCASDDRLSLIVPLRTNGQARPTGHPTPTATAGTTGMGLAIHMRGTETSQVADSATPLDDPIRTVSAGGTHAGLLMRNNVGGAEMVTPVEEPARTLTTKGHQSLLMPYYGRTEAQTVDRPVPTVPTRDRFALVDLDQLVDDCGFRMLEPHEIAAAMAFPDRYIPLDLTKKDRVKLAGNAVTPPVMQWICGRVLQALERAA